ncbi:hypothetical protein ERJ75_001375100 [Trypanosoma vivax]|uniref:Leucine-rich repeat protein (LRRP) n=1 Tax=Trypanosoma vivax (strain Y486) TaxID=1055687 RepID=F9WLC4_TRYVY|nr:hypothetical protein ERJ75_001375100 [Trypanosoma vivax]CCD18313.1 hypothetical protein, conserved in T. vivax [Trypanosoma vivax Y486]|eukprot:CCD18313.1 hypothetical protein, conserved in T. vivax [Trypanosoma vivax Y486]
MSDSCNCEACVGTLLQLPRIRALHNPEICTCTHDVPVEACWTQLRTLPVQRCASPPIVELLNKMGEHAEASTSLCSTETRDVASLAGLPHLRTRNICFKSMQDSVLCLLDKCAFLDMLDLSAPIYLTDISPLAGVLTLEELNMHNCSHVGRGAGDLGEMPRLRVLNLNTLVSDYCLVVLGESLSFVKLYLSSCRHVSDITPVLGTATLCELNVLCRKNSRSTKHNFPCLPNLRSLSIGCVDSSKYERHILKHPQGLTSLKLRRDDSRAVKSSFTERMQTLVELERDANKMYVNLDRLFELPHLRVLSLRCPGPSANVKFLPKFASMVKLSLTPHRKPTDLRPLANVESMEELHFNCFKLPRKGVIGSPPLLRHL